MTLAALKDASSLKNTLFKSLNFVIFVAILGQISYYLSICVIFSKENQHRNHLWSACVQV